jgi:hypothetical protein
MLLFLIIVAVLIGVAYADFCLIDNTAHFGVCFGKVAEAEQARIDALRDAVDETVAPAAGAACAEKPDPGLPAWLSPSPTPQDGTRVPPPPRPAAVWLLPELEPVLELREGWQGAATSG